MSVDKHEAAAAPVGVEMVPLRAERVAFVELDGETVAYEEERGTLHLLDQIATVVWGCCDGSASVSQLVDELAGAFGAERAQVDADVRALLGRLVADGLVVDARDAS